MGKSLDEAKKKTCGFFSVGWGYLGNERRRSIRFLSFALEISWVSFDLLTKYLLEFLSFISCIIISGWGSSLLLHFLGWPSEMNSRASYPLLLPPLNSCWLIPLDIPLSGYSLCVPAVPIVTGTPSLAPSPPSSTLSFPGCPTLRNGCRTYICRKRGRSGTLCTHRALSRDGL